MPDNVVPLRPPEHDRRVWRCVCGMALFWLYADGTIECAECGGAVGGMDGYWRCPTLPDASPEPAPSNASEVGSGACTGVDPGSGEVLGQIGQQIERIGMVSR